MTQVYYAVAFAGRVLFISNTRASCDAHLIKLAEDFPDQAVRRACIRELIFPPTTGADAAFAWINSLLDGSALSTISGQEVA